jgi:hypothetical protein
MDGSEARDIPIIRLRPLRERSIKSREFERIVASIRAIGLIEPLVVYPENGEFVITDGVQRCRALAELGVEIAPCIIGARREAFCGIGKAAARNRVGKLAAARRSARQNRDPANQLQQSGGGEIP